MQKIKTGKKATKWRLLKENGQYLNFDVPKNKTKLTDALEKIFSKLTTMNLDIQIILEALGKGKPTNETWGTLNSPNAKNNPSIPFSESEEPPF